MRQGGATVRRISPGGASRAGQSRQTVIDLARHDIQRPPFLGEAGLLLPQLFLHDGGVAVLQKIGDRLQRHIQTAQVTDGVERFKFPCTVVTVPGPGIRIGRGKKPLFFIMPQGAHAHMKHGGDLADAEQPALVRLLRRMIHGQLRTDLSASFQGLHYAFLNETSRDGQNRMKYWIKEKNCKNEKLPSQVE